ncbi:hypothetical protein [Salinispora mooreana]|uniref:hypothetical protein n=1 Tax=Salinispora mooreana TaxID=999545 RepID=UPI00039EB49B|nr:hypothetical protein [Salinispora mooreana]
MNVTDQGRLAVVVSLGSGWQQPLGLGPEIVRDDPRLLLTPSHWSDQVAEAQFCFIEIAP